MKKAIILAAGKGTRLRPLTETTPKPLIEVNGLPMIERQIQFLLDKGINEIIVVTGYLSEKFEYLVERYGVRLIHNDKYDLYNNLYTMYLVKEFLQDAYVIEGDIYMHHNILDASIHESTYFSPLKYEFKDEWMLISNNENQVVEIVVGSIPGSYIMCGVSYWSIGDGKYVQELLQKAIETQSFEDLFWDNLIADNLEVLKIKVRELSEDDLFEIDSLEDLTNIKKFVERS